MKVVSKYLLSIFILFFGISTGKAVAQTQSEKQPVGELLYQIIQSEGTDAAIAQYKELRAEGSSRYDLGENRLNQFGYRLLNENNVEAAVAIFKLNAEMHPESINVWDSLAEGYFNLGEKKKAEEYYQKELEMIESDTSLAPPVRNFYRYNAQTQLTILQNFDPPGATDFHYASFFGGPPAGQWDMQNIAEFKEREGIKLSYNPNNLYQSPVPGNVEQTLTGPYPADVGTGFVMGDYRRFIERGLLDDISDLWEEENWDEVFPTPFKKMATHNGKQYFVPMAYQWNPIWYRKDIFEEHGLTPPETWDELLELCGRLNELGYTPFTIGVQNWPPPVARWFTTFNLRLNGPEFHEQVMRGEVPYTDERIRNVFIHWRELFRQNAFANDSYDNTYASALQDLNSGKAVMYNLGEWLFESPPIQQISAKLDFFSFPKINPDVTRAEIVHSYGAYITTNNSDLETSKELLKWLASAESQQSNSEANSRIVANMKVDPDIYSDVQKRIIQHINDTEVLVPLFEMNTHPEFAQKALTVFQEFWQNPEDIDSALNKLEEARQKVFES